MFSLVTSNTMETHADRSKFRKQHCESDGKPRNITGEVEEEREREIDREGERAIGRERERGREAASMGAD